MKIRSGFVSNSSSSSFIIDKRDITMHQYDLLKKHSDIAESDAWHISEDEKNIYGSTYMDNFDMHNYLKLIDIDITKVRWEEY